MQDKISAAIAYCNRFGTDANTRNNASNIFASSYNEYMTIWEALENL